MRTQLSAPLPYQVRADLFLHLATMEKAGLPLEKAWSMLRLPASYQSRVGLTQRALARGQDIAQAGLNNGLWSPLDCALLKAALAAGDPSPGYRRLAQHYQQKATQSSQIKSRMILPLFLLVASLLIQPLPALMSGSIRIENYFFQVFKLLSAFGIVIFLGKYVHRLWQRTGVTAARLPADALLLRLPLFGDLHRRRNLCDFWGSLALLLEAGLPMFDALPVALHTTSNGLIRNELARILPRMHSGMTLAQALDGIGYLEQDSLLPLVETGDGSGTLPEMLTRYAAGETTRLAQTQQQISTWLPRIAYGIVAGFIAYNLLTGSGVGPKPPDGL